MINCLNELDRIVEQMTYEKRKKSKNPISQFLAKRYEKKQEKLLIARKEELKKLREMLDKFQVEEEKEKLIKSLHDRMTYLTFSEQEDEEKVGEELALIGELLLFYEPLDESKFMTKEEAWEDLKQRLIKEGLWNEE